VGEKNRLAKQDTTPTLFLNAGDDSRGTSFFDTYGMKIIPDYLNAAGIAAWTVGNHDFDNGETELAAAIAKFKFPVLGGNIASQNAILKDKFKPYIVLPNFGVVIMGISTQETAKFSKASPTTVFSNEIASAQKILEEIRVKVLKANPTYKVIALTHIGYEQDLALAKATKGISVIIGGHSHTGMGGMKGQLETDAKLPYPQMVPSADVGQKVCVVQAAYK
jgi:2',3'-cyclic-nucleotide 2'-phosphodiesterase (5'-nucleotidase family)